MDIAHIEQGMRFEQVFKILNELIDAVNSRLGALDGAVSDGKIDYNSLANKPSINGNILKSGMDQRELGLDLTDTVKQTFDTFSERVAGLEGEMGKLPSRLSSIENTLPGEAERISKLEGEQSSRLSELAQLRTEYNAAKQQYETLRLAAESETKKIAEQYSDTIQQAKDEVLSTVEKNYIKSEEATRLLSGKADVANTPSSADWQTLLAEMRSQVTAMRQQVAQAQSANNIYQQANSKLDSIIDALDGKTISDCSSGKCEDTTLNIKATLFDKGIN